MKIENTEFCECGHSMYDHAARVGEAGEHEAGEHEAGEHEAGECFVGGCGCSRFTGDDGS